MAAPPSSKMDALPPKVDSISGEVSSIREALRGYLEEGIVSNRKLQPPRTKAGRDLLHQLLGRLDQVSTNLDDIRNLTAPHTHGPPTALTPHAPHNPLTVSSLPPAGLALDTPAAAPPSSSPPSSSATPAITRVTPVPVPQIPLVPQTPQTPIIRRQQLGQQQGPLTPVRHQAERQPKPQPPVTGPDANHPRQLDAGDAPHSHQPNGSAITHSPQPAGSDIVHTNVPAPEPELKAPTPKAVSTTPIPVPVPTPAPIQAPSPAPIAASLPVAAHVQDQIQIPAEAQAQAQVGVQNQEQTKPEVQPTNQEQQPNEQEAHHVPHPPPYQITLKDGSVYRCPLPSAHSSPLFDCTYPDINVLNEELFELYSSHPVVRDLGYFKLEVRDLPPLDVQRVARPSKDHATSFSYKADRHGLVKVDTGKRFKFSSPNLPLPMSSKLEWSLDEQRHLWNSSAAAPPKGTWPYIIGNPLFRDVELSPGEKLRRRGRTTLEGVNTQYVYFNLTGKTITTMHREDAHVRSENLLRSGQHKFWCFVKPAFSKRLEEKMALDYPEMRQCSQAVRHLSRHIPPSKLDEWGVEYTLDYCVPGQAVVTEPGTYHQVLNLGPNYAIAINLEYNSSPDMPPNYQFCDRNCPDKFAMSADDFRIYDKSPPPEEEELPRTPDTTGSQHKHAPVPAPHSLAKLRPDPSVLAALQPTTPPPEQPESDKQAPVAPQPVQPTFVGPSGRQNNDTVDTGKAAAAPHPPSPARNQITQPQIQEIKSAAPFIPTPERSASSPSGPSDVPAAIPPPATSQTQVFVPSGSPSAQPQPPTWESLSSPPAPGAAASIQQPGPPTLGPSPGPLEAVSTAPAQQSGPPKQSPSRLPGTTAFSVQLVPQPPQPIKQDASQPSPQRPRKEARAPLRKTARMINPDREDDEASPRPLKRQKVESPPAATAQDWPSQGALQHLSTLLRGRDPTRTGSLTAENLCGKPSFERLAHLVREWRRYSRSTGASLSGFRLTKAVDDTARGFPELHLLLSRLLKTKVAVYVETAMAQHGQELQNVMNSMLQMLGWSEVKRPILHDYLREGKCWATMCGRYDGLLCFVPPDAVSWDLALFKDEVAQFHAEINTEYVRRLCSVGDILQRAIWDCLELPEFVWESESTTWLSAEQLLPLLAPFRLLKSCYYNPTSGASWPRPAGWTWDWPTDPSAVKPGDKTCSLCPRKSCRCAEIKIPQIPRIVDDRSKWPGIRSVGPHQPNDILGELVGELVPLGACGADWTISLRRPDLEDQPVADIYPRQMGNWVRKVGHSTDPSAMFRVLKISGRWRQVLVAMRHIGDGEEITAKYGRGFTKEQPYSLVEGLH